MQPSTPQSQPAVANLRAWWNNFTSASIPNVKPRRDADWQRAADGGSHTVFGKPLKESLGYASVQISTAHANGELYVWGSIPVVVAKCGLYLKENATEVQGTFRVNGSNKRMRELQAIFEAPPRYGKSLDWKKENYTTHDVASVFRRYLTQMPEPVIPHDLYHAFRDALAKKPYNQEEVIAQYKALIRSMPLANQHLLLYVLDLLSVFARKSDKNLMTAANLAVIFRPGLISHPNHEMSPQEHQLSQEVLEFLIAHQDWFMLDIPPLPQSQALAGPPVPQKQPSSANSEEFEIIPSSEDDYPDVDGGRKSSGKDKRKLTRRRTQDEKVDSSGVKPPRVSQEGELSPVNESPSSPTREQGATGVARSRTLPSRRDGSGEGTAAERARLLRKHKRSSSGHHRPSETSDSTLAG